MPRIHVLPDILASQVAAGEVIERPASVVKELVENSLDAGACEVLIEIERGGTALVRITDDGCGMDRDDALLSLERHATSKLRSSSDLSNILTLGFRGEAIPSIASVSRFRLITRERASVDGTEIQVHGGKIIDVRSAGCAPGTMIEIKQLFYNIPARRKFLKADSTESSHVEHEVRLHALAAPTVRFRFRRDGNEVLELPAVASKSDRLRHLIGVESAGDLIEIPLFHGNGFSLEGYLLPASHARKGRKHQCVFLNGRPIEDLSVSRGLNEGFRGGLMDGLHPAAWLWVQMDAALVDVNVHPAKREVRFHRSHELREGIAAAVAQALQRQLQRVSSPAPERAAPASGQIRSWAVAQHSLSVKQEVARVSPAPPMEFGSWTQNATQVQMPLDDMPHETKSHAAQGASAFRWVGLLHNRFAILESHDGLVLFDPRAARERIVYEHIIHAPQRGLECQGLLVPLLIQLDPREKDAVMRNLERFTSAGLEISEFGGSTLQVRSLPAFLQLTDPRGFVHDVIDDLIAGSNSSAVLAYDKLARCLAKRAGLQTIITSDSCQELLKELFACELPYCAADGRPTLTEFSLRELDRRFGYR